MPGTTMTAIGSFLSVKPEDVGLSSDRLARLGETIRAGIARGLIPGATALVARRGKVAYFEALGVRDPASGAPMRQDTIFRIYSMTKPIVSVAAMMLVEEGRLMVADPLAKYVPEFAGPKVAVERGDVVDLVPAAREITIQDLLRHTSGLTYEFRGTSAVQRMYMDAKIFRRNQTNADQAGTLAKLPLMHQPGARWEYSRSTDVLGRVIEVISGQTLGEFLAGRIFAPLGMVDTGFHVPSPKHDRLAEAFPKDPEAGTAVQLIEVREKPTFESGGGGLVSTIADYARFCQMMLGGGVLDRTRLLGRKTVELMNADHLGSVTGSPDLLLPGYGFGLGFAVRRAPGLAQIPGSVGEFYWGGLAGTTFWIDPREQLFAVAMIQGPGQREYFRMLFRNLVCAAVVD
jgi:CubicO group peptidase (beta-lactamase class C family)